MNSGVAPFPLANSGRSGYTQQILVLLSVAWMRFVGTAWSVGEKVNSLGRDLPVIKQIDCGLPNRCQELVIDNDPEARLPNGALAPFRGWADPSLRYAPATGELWLAYSWLDTAVKPRLGRKPLIDFRVRTHLAKSVDQGRSFSMVKEINTNTSGRHNSNGARGWLSHEVAALSRRAASDWQLMWMTYLDPYGPLAHGVPHLVLSAATTPASLGEQADAWIRGRAAPAVTAVRYNLSSIDGLGGCVAFTEPSLFSYAGERFQEGSYLAVNCIVYQGKKRRPGQEKLLLFKEDGSGYQLLGHLFDSADARAYGGQRMEQGELVMARDGTVLLLATPVIDDVRHRGCYLFEVDSLHPPRMARGAGGKLIARAHIVDSASGERGNGACAYDALSETGVLLVRRDFDFDQQPIKMRFSILQTGYHP